MVSWKAAGRGWAGRAKDSRETCLLPGLPPDTFPASVRVSTAVPASRSRAAGVEEEARGGLQGSAGARGWSQRPRRTGRSRPPGGSDLGWESRRLGGRRRASRRRGFGRGQARGAAAAACSPRAARADGTVRGAPRADGGASSPRLSSGGARAERRARLLPLQRPREQLEEEQRRRASPRGGPQHG